MNLRALVLALVVPAVALSQPCPGDGNGDRQVTIAELVAAVNAALNGCATPTPTPIPTTCSYGFMDNLPNGSACEYLGPTTYELCETATMTASWSTSLNEVFVVIIGATDSFAVYGTIIDQTTARVDDMAPGPDFLTLYAARGTITLASPTALTVHFTSPGNPCGGVDYAGTFTEVVRGQSATR